MSYTLKLDLSEDELRTLKTVLIADLQRSEREGTESSPHAVNVVNILNSVESYGNALAEAIEYANREV